MSSDDSPQKTHYQVLVEEAHKRGERIDIRPKRLLYGERSSWGEATVITWCWDTHDYRIRK